MFWLQLTAMILIIVCCICWLYVIRQLQKSQRRYAKLVVEMQDMVNILSERLGTEDPKIIRG